MKKLILLPVAFLMAYALAPSQTRVAFAVEDEVTLTGCLIRGDEADEFLLTDVLPAGVDMATRAQAETAPGKLSGSTSVIYWLDDLDEDDDLPNLAGSRVEVRGEVEGEVDRGEMEIERDGEWVKLEIKSDGRKVKTRLPYISVSPAGVDTPVGTSGTLKDDEEIELNINVQKFEVKDIKVVAGECK